MAITKTTKPAVTPEASEDIQALAAAKASKQAFADAQTLAIERQADHDNAEMAEAEMEASFNRGDATATASDWSHVQADVTRTEMLHDAAQAAEKRAESAVVSTDVQLAELALGWVRSALKGVEVHPSFYTPKALPTAAVAYVIQTVPTDDLGGGSVGGKVQVKYYRPDLYRALDAGDIHDAAERAHCTVLASSSVAQGYGDGMKIDVVHVTIKHGASVVPLIVRNPESSQASSHVATAFACNLADSCQATHDSPVRGNPANREYVGAAIAVRAVSGEVTDLDVDDAGVRTTTVKVVLSYRRESDLRTVNVDKHLGQLCEDWKGSMVPMFGRCTSIKGGVGFPNQMIPPTTEITVEVVFVSRVR